MKLLLIIYLFGLFSTIESKSNLTLDSFFNYTNLVSVSLSPNSEYVLVQTRRPSWDSNSFENSLWLYQIVERRKKLITNQLFDGIKPQWSPTGKSIVFLMKNDSASNTFSYQFQSKINSNAEKNLYFYSLETDQIKSISIGDDTITAFTWSHNDSSIYYATVNLNSTDSKLKDAFRYQSNPTSTIRLINIDNSTRKDITNAPFMISELLFSSNEDKLIFNSVSLLMENTYIYQIYSVDLKNPSSINKLTNDPGLKSNFQLIKDKNKVLFLSLHIDSSGRPCNLTQQRLYSIDLTNNLIQRWASDFQGYVQDYTIRSDGSIYFLGLLGINIRIYSQISPENDSVLHDGFDGCYQSISSSMNSITFVFSSFSKAQEVYFVQDISQLKSATQISNENSQFDQIDLPQAKSYQWINPEDNQIVEGILHYPPGKFEQKNLPTFVLNARCKSNGKNVEAYRISTERARDIILSPLDRPKCLLSNACFAKCF